MSLQRLRNVVPWMVPVGPPICGSAVDRRLREEKVEERRINDVMADIAALENQHWETICSITDGRHAVKPMTTVWMARLHQELGREVKREEVPDLLRKMPPLDPWRETMGRDYVCEYVEIGRAHV